MREYYRNRRNQYTKEFLETKNKGKLIRLQNGGGTEQERDHWQELKLDYNYNQVIERERKRAEAEGLAPPKVVKRPPSSKTHPSEFTPKHVEYLRERYLECHKLKGLIQKGKKVLTAEELSDYEALKRDHNEWLRWDKWQKSRERSPELGASSPELRALLNANREGWLKYINKYMRPPENRAEAKRFKARQGTPEQLAEFDKLWEPFKTYENARQKHYRGSAPGQKQVIIEFDTDLANTVDILEATREEHNEWYSKYRLTGAKDDPEKLARRTKLEDGQGTKEELEEYDRLREAYLQHKRAYYAGARMTRRAGIVEDEAAMGKPQKKIKIVSDKGLPRWFRPKSNTRARMIRNRKALHITGEGRGRSDEDDDDDNNGQAGSTSSSVLQEGAGGQTTDGSQSDLGPGTDQPLATSRHPSLATFYDSVKKTFVGGTSALRTDVGSLLNEVGTELKKPIVGTMSPRRFKMRMKPTMVSLDK